MKRGVYINMMTGMKKLNYGKNPMIMIAIILKTKMIGRTKYKVK